MWENKSTVNRLMTAFFAIMLVSVAFAVAIGNMSQKVSASAGEEEEEMGTDPIEPLSPAVTTRSVLAELFTGTWCPPCQAAEGALDRLADEYPRTQLSILEWHLSDSFENPADLCDARRNYYGTPPNPFYVPAAFFDGENMKIGGGADPDDPVVYGDYKTRIDNALAVPSQLTITVTGALDDPAPGQATVRANITAIENIMTPNLHARFVVYEDHNYTYFTGGREYRLRNTVVAAEKVLAETPITISKEQTLSFTRTFAIDPLWDTDKLGVVVFVQTDDKTIHPYPPPPDPWLTDYNWAEILQSTSLNFTSSKVDLTLTPADITFSNPTPNDGDLVTIYATVHNVGNLITPTPVTVRFYDGDPSAGGVQIGTDQNAGIILGGGGSSAVQVNWDTTGKEGTHEIVVVVDPNDNIYEPENENNNIAPRTITVGPAVVIPPYATSKSPTGTNAPLDTNITVQWSEIMDWDTVNASFSYTDGITIWDATNGTFSHDPITRTSTFDPTDILDYGETYNVTFDTTATDSTGEPLDQNKNGIGGEVGDELSWEFTTVDFPPEAQSLLVDSYADGSPGILHIVSTTPTFDWSYYDPESDAQTDYEVRVGTTSGGNDMWAPGPAGAPGLSDVYGGLLLADCADYYFGVRVKDDGLWSPWNETLFHTNCLPPAPTEPVNPLNGSAIPSSGSATVSWTSGGVDSDGDTLTYYWEVSLVDTFVALEASGSTSSTTSDTFITNPTTTYYWRVNATDSWEFSDYGNMPVGYWMFNTTTPNDPPEAQTLLVDTYADGTAGILHILSANPTFDWSYYDPELVAQTDYEVRVGTTSGGNDMWAPGPAGSSGVQVVYAGSALANGTDYYFGVRVMDDLQWSPWNETMFHTNGVPPAPTTPINPPHMDTTVPASSSTTVSWTSGGVDPEGDPITYGWQVDTDSGFAPPEASGTTPVTSSIGFTTASGTTYYWRVAACDDWGECSAWSTTWEFTTVDDPPTIDVLGPGSTQNEKYIQGDLIPVTWIANDDKSLPPNPINISYWDPMIGLTEIATNQLDNGWYDWDTSTVPCSKTYWMNLSVRDSSGQMAFDDSDYGFTIKCPVTIGNITGTVVDENGDPIEGATVTLTDSIGTTIGTKETDSSGNFRFADVEQGIDEYTITAEKENYETTSRGDIDVTAGQTTPVVITLDTDGTITGKVVDEDGNPIEGATVKLVDEDGNVAFTKTGADGSFSFTGVGYGNYTVEISASGYNTKTTDQFAVDKNNLVMPLPDSELTRPSHPIAPEGDFLQDYWWILLVIAIIIAVIILVLVVAKRKKPEEEVPPKELEAVEEAPVAAEAVAAPEAFMLACAKCGGEVESGYKLCPHCGESLEAEEVEETEAPAPIVCKTCGGALEPEYLICPNCGTKI